MAERAHVENAIYIRTHTRIHTHIYYIWILVHAHTQHSRALVAGVHIAKTKMEEEVLPTPLSLQRFPLSRSDSKCIHLRELPFPLAVKELPQVEPVVIWRI